MSVDTNTFDSWNQVLEDESFEEPLSVAGTGRANGALSTLKENKNTKLIYQIVEDN